VTLIIGVKCSDGLVVGADAAATFGALGQATIRQETKKLEILHKKIIVGVSGHVGLGQRITAEVSAQWAEERLGSKKPQEAMGILRNEFWKHAEGEWRAAHVTAPIIGGGAAMESAACWAIVGLPLSKVPTLLHFDQQCSPEEVTFKLPFVTIGSGQKIADPFLAFLWRVFWSKGDPLKISDAQLAVYWTLDHAIRTHPGGVAGRKQIITLEQSAGEWIATEIPEEQMEEHGQAVSEAEDVLRRWMYPTPAEVPGESPPPAPAKSS